MTTTGKRESERSYYMVTVTLSFSPFVWGLRFQRVSRGFFLMIGPFAMTPQIANKAT